MTQKQNSRKQQILPRGKEGPGFNSIPDIIKSFCFTFDKTSRYDNIIKDCRAVFVFNLFSKDTFLPVLDADFVPAKVPILDLY